MNNDLRSRLRKANSPKKSVDTKLAEFFSEDEKLKKYAKKGELRDENDLAIATRKLLKKAQKQAKSIATKAGKIDASKAKSRFSGKNAYRSGAIVVFIAVLFVGGITLTTNDTNTESAVQGATIGGESEEAVEPEFAVATVSESFQPTEVAYDPERKVASFGISLDEETDVIISQQEVTAADASRENFLLSVAQSFDINREVQTAKGPLFLGSNQKQRVVTAVFLEGTYLFFLRSNNLIEDSTVIDVVEKIQI